MGRIDDLLYGNSWAHVFGGNIISTRLHTQMGETDVADQNTERLCFEEGRVQKRCTARHQIESD